MDQYQVQHDPSAEVMARFVSPETVLALRDAVFARQRSLLMTAVELPTAEEFADLDHPQLADLFERCCWLIVDDLLADIDRFSSARWLWYLRRLPRHVFEPGDFGLYRREAGMADAASGLSSASEVPSLSRS